MEFCARFTGIQQENRHIRQLQHENKELRAALEEHQKALELIMSKYRKQTSSLIKSTKFDEITVSNQKSAVRLLLLIFQRIITNPINHFRMKLFKALKKVFMKSFKA